MISNFFTYNFSCPLFKAISMSLITPKTKILHNLPLSRRFGRYSHWFSIKVGCCVKLAIERLGVYGAPHWLTLVLMAKIRQKKITSIRFICFNDFFKTILMISISGQWTSFIFKRGRGYSDMGAGKWLFLGSQRVELKTRPFFLLALRARRPREVGFY